jgi:glycosyltransferase involved in cell wall biosynthesis
MAGNVEWGARVADMREVYGRARFVLAPSAWEEPWGRIATEAQVSGIPVLASDRGGLPEAVGPGGILLDPEGPFDRWIEALSALWDDPEVLHRYGEAARLHSARPEIQPERLAGRFRCILADHATRGSADRPSGTG